MDSAQFDGLVRRFGQSRSRRQTLRGLAGIAASGALALSGRAVSAQDCKRDGKACKKNSQCCSGNCGVGTGQGPLPGACAPACPALPACSETCRCPSGSGQVCQEGRCCLPAGGNPSCGPDCCDSGLCCSDAMRCDPGVCTYL
jgi:hypothetical protein